MSSTAATFDFSGSVVLVTGGGTGIGRAIAAAFAHAGASVVISGRRADKLDQAAAEIGSDQVSTAPGDVARREDVAQLVATVLERHDRLDVVISNAAAYFPGQLTELDDGDWETMRAANVDGFFHLAKATLPELEKTGGSLIAVSSVSGLRGDWAQAGYNATKGAVTLFVQSLALDWGARGVRVNAVAPAFTATDATGPVLDNETLISAAVNRVALGRIAQPQDIAGPVLFLASEAAAYVTGVVLPVDGGTSASTGQAHVA